MAIKKVGNNSVNDFYATKVGNKGGNDIYAAKDMVNVQSNVDQSIRKLEAGQQFHTGEWNVIDKRPDDRSTLNPTGGGGDTNVKLGGDMSDSTGNSSNRTTDIMSSVTNNFQSAGLSTSTLPDFAKNLESKEANIKQEEEDRLAKMREAINAQWDETIERQEKIGEKEIGGTQARLATTRGMGASSSRMQFISNQQKENQGLIKQFETQRSQALLTADMGMAEQAESRINQLRDYNFKLREQGFKEAESMLNLSLKKQQMDMDMAQFLMDIPAGQTITVEGKEYVSQSVESVEPFFKSSDIVGLMKQLPTGKTTSVTDPITGQEYTIEGYGDAGEDNTTHKFTDKNTGNVTFVTTDGQGNIINTAAAKGVGEKYKPTGSGSVADDETEDFFKDIESSKSAFLEGKTWGQEWSTLYGKYSWNEDDGTKEEVDKQNKLLSNRLDDMLGKEKWTEEDAYGKHMQSKFKKEEEEKEED